MREPEVFLYPFFFSKYNCSVRWDGRKGRQETAGMYDSLKKKKKKKKQKKKKQKKNQF